MKKIVLLSIVSVIMPSCQPAQKKDYPSKTVFIIVDGIPADAAERVSTPNIKNISSTGGYSRAWVGGGMARIFPGSILNIPMMPVTVLMTAPTWTPQFSLLIPWSVLSGTPSESARRKGRTG